MPPLTCPGSTISTRPSPEWKPMELRGIMREEGPRRTTSHDLHRCIPAVPVLHSLAQLRNSFCRVLRALAYLQHAMQMYRRLCANPAIHNLAICSRRRDNHRRIRTYIQYSKLQGLNRRAAASPPPVGLKESLGNVPYKPEPLATAILGRASALPAWAVDDWISRFNPSKAATSKRQRDPNADPRRQSPRTRLEAGSSSSVDGD